MDKSQVTRYQFYQINTAMFNWSPCMFSSIGFDLKLIMFPFSEQRFFVKFLKLFLP